MPYGLIDPTTAAAAPVTTLGAPLTNVGETLSSMETFLGGLALTNESDIGSAQFDDWINKAYKYVAEIIKPIELDGNIALSLVAGQPFYKLPANISYTRDVSISDPVDFNTGGRPLAKIDLAEYRRLPVPETATGYDIPRAAFRFGSLMVFYPTPDKSYTAVVDVKASVQSLVLSTDSPILQPQLHYSIMLRSKRIALRDLKRYQEAAMAQNDFLEEIRPLINTDAGESQNAEYHFIPVKSYGGLYIDED